MGTIITNKWTDIDRYTSYCPRGQPFRGYGQNNNWSVLMKKILVLFTLLIILIGNINADNSIESKKIRSFISKLGVDLNNIVVEDLEPAKFTTFDNYFYEEQSNQNAYTWSTNKNYIVKKTDFTLKSSSTLKGYPVGNLFDKNSQTAWVEGDTENGIGEWIFMQFSPRREHSEYLYPVGLEDFALIPGYQKNSVIWEENNRVKSAILVFKKLEYESGKEVYKYTVLRLHFKDSMELQVFKISQYNQLAHDEIWLIIEDVYKGTKYNDTCISEIVLSGNIYCSALEPL